MGRFDFTPPQAELPRAETPEATDGNQSLPEVPATMPDLPMIPMENFADNLPAEAYGRLPGLFGDEEDDVELL